MAKYRWEGMDREGNRLSGIEDVKSEKDLRKLLRSQGIRPRKIIPPSFFDIDLNDWMATHGMAKSFGDAEILSFTKQLSTMISAGIPILQALEIYHKSERNISMRKAVGDIAIDVAEGKTIAEALAKQGGFTSLYCNLVKAGEAGGILDAILKKLAEHMERQRKLKGQIKSAMIYPILVVVVGVIVIYVMMTFVVPKLAEMIAEGGQQLPAITQLVLDVSKFFQHYSIHLALGGIGFVIALRSFLKTKEGREFYDSTAMKLPLFGPIIIKGNLASFSRTLSTMLSAGISLVDALSICIETVDNVVMARDLVGLKKAIVEGKTLTEGLVKIEYFPAMVAQMVGVGEQTGNVDNMLVKVAEVFEEQVNNLVANMTKMIEPIIIVVLGGIVAVIMVAMYMPIFVSAGGIN